MPPLTVSQQALLDNVRRTSAARARKRTKAAIDDGVAREDIDEASRRLASAKVVHHLDPLAQLPDFDNRRLLDVMIDERRLLSRRETGNLHPVKARVQYAFRLLQEFKLYGGRVCIVSAVSELFEGERPLYAALDYIDRPTSFPRLRYYGFVRLELDVDESCVTVTPADSATVESEDVFAWDNLDAVVCSEIPGADGRWLRYILNGDEPATDFGSGPYVEVQILGGVQLSAIRAISYPRNDPIFDAAAVRALEGLADAAACEVHSH